MVNKLVDQGKEQVKQKAKSILKEIGKQIWRLISPYIGWIALIMLLVILVAGLIDWDEEGGNDSTLGGGIYEATGWWWPIGSKETTTEGGKLFASGTPPPVQITSQFAEDRGSYLHEGVDMDYAPDVEQDKQNIVAVRSGTVTTAGFDSSAGNWVIIDHGDGFKSIYMHMENDSLKVKVDDTVDYGQVLGLMGNTGNSEGEHLHIEIHKNGVAVNPLDYISQEKPRPMEFTSYGGLSGTSALGEFLKEWENCSMRGYLNGTIKNYNSTEYIYKCITKDKKYYIMHDDLYSGAGNRNYGFGICFYKGGEGFQNTSYFKEEGIDVTQSKYNSYGESKISVDIVDRIKDKMIEERRSTAKSIAKNAGVTLKEYQIDAIAACLYQGWESTPEFLAAYKKYGIDEKIRSYCTGMGTSESRYKANWILFSTGKYIGADGKEIKISSTGTIKDEQGAGYTKTITVGRKKYKVYNQGAYPGNIPSAGCSISSEAIVLSAYGSNKSPEGMANYVNWGFPRSISQIADDLTNNGVKSTASVKFSQQNNSSTHNTAIKEIKNNLSQGRPVVILVRRGPDARYTGGAHYIVLVGFDKSGKPVVADPNGGRARTESTLEQIVKDYIYYPSDYEQGYVLINQ